MQSQFNFIPGRADAEEGRQLGALLLWANKQFGRLASVMRGPEYFDVGTVATAETINPGIVDLTLVTLAGNAVLTLERTKSRTGTVGFLELQQDATGGRTPSWVNALNTPAVSTTANKKTLLLCVNDGDGWVLSVVASAF